MASVPRKLDYVKRAKYPNLNDTNHEVTSGPTESYNCVAWVLHMTDRRMWPSEDKSYFWPSPRKDDTVPAFVEGLSYYGFEPCNDAVYEEGYEKLALYTDDTERADEPLHIALQLPNGEWSSKLGTWEDISHIGLDVLTSPGYGEPRFYFRRQIAST